METRRHFLKCLSFLPLAVSGCATWAKDTSARWVNDIHSKLNRTRVAQRHRPGSRDELRRIIREASSTGQHISICGGCHAMGGQQFGTDTQLIDINHTRAGIQKSSAAFRRLIDLAIRFNGSYYLTYHKWATKEQLLACYPEFESFMAMKRRYDPDEIFQSDWYRHNKKLLRS